MKLLSSIIYKTNLLEVHGSTHVAISSIKIDSRGQKKDSVFVAITGTVIDGHDRIDEAIQNGAIAVVCEKLPNTVSKNITYVIVSNTSEALGIMASNYYDNACENLKIIGITGTNGKTTCVTLLHNLFKNLGYNVGLISTVENRINNEVLPSTHTTPNALALHELFFEMVQKKCQYVFMEVSSHALVQNRVAGVPFAIAGFTNITHDHLDYHVTFSNYIEAKKILFDKLSKHAVALVNKDDKNGLIMLQNCKAKQNTYSINGFADYKCKIIENQPNGLLLQIENQEVWVKLNGTFNAYNILLVYAVSQILQQDKINVLTILSTLNSVSGRFQTIKSHHNVLAIVDYAHTPNALKNVLETIHELKLGNEKMVTVIGCGGNRDAVKRPIMAQIASEQSDVLVITTDNPRFENATDIINDMLQGIPKSQAHKVIVIEDRKLAIEKALSIASPHDIVLIAGKGHEKYQEVMGVKNHFDDAEEVKQQFEKLIKN